MELWKSGDEALHNLYKMNDTLFKRIIQWLQCWIYLSFFGAVLKTQILDNPSIATIYLD